MTSLSLALRAAKLPKSLILAICQLFSPCLTVARRLFRQNLGIHPVFWITDPTYLWVIVATVVLSILGFHYFHRISRVFLPVSDAFGLAIFIVIGSNKALMLGHEGIVAVLMGLLTGVAEGMLRDVLARRIPMVLRKEIYAIASIAGASAYVVMNRTPTHPYIATMLAICVVLLLRLSAIYWHLSLPVFAWITLPSPPVQGDIADTNSAQDRLKSKPHQKYRVHMIPPNRR